MLCRTGAMVADQVGFVELEVARVLSYELVHAVKPLQEDGAALTGLSTQTALPKLVSIAHPLPLHQQLEAL